MNVKKLQECGYEEAALGFSLSYNSTVNRAKELFPSFAFKGNGESKFLESIYVWIDVEAPRYWWSEADTYRISTKQSASTMHTLTKRHLTQADFETLIPDVSLELINKVIDNYNDKLCGIQDVKNILPEGFLQRRVWCMSYKTLQNVYSQRKNHRLPQWRFFFTELLPQLNHVEFVVKP